MRPMLPAALLLAAASAHPAEPMLQLEPAPNSVEMIHDGARYWCVLEPSGFGLPMSCWPVPAYEQRMACRRFPEAQAVVCRYPDGKVITRREGKPAVEGAAGYAGLRL